MGWVLTTEPEPIRRVKDRCPTCDIEGDWHDPATTDRTLNCDCNGASS